MSMGPLPQSDIDYLIQTYMRNVSLKSNKILPEAVTMYLEK